MNYTDNQLRLKNIFNLSDREISIPQSPVRIINCLFRSVIRPTNPVAFRKENESSTLPDILMEYFDGNSDFTYPIFMPVGSERVNGAIILLHGLNERSWTKYLSWAHYLSEHTGKAVILFPMAFHINRSPAFWSDPRYMLPIANERATSFPGQGQVTPFNAALSSRLDRHPEWFCSSGLQSCYDILSLTASIRSGEHPLFRERTSVDFFAYSVGAFLLEVMLLADPGEVLSESRCFLLMGGSSFQQMKGISRYIMDQRAFDQLEETYIRQDPRSVRNKIHLPRLDSFNSLWSSFLSMLRPDRQQELRDRSFRKMAGRICAIGLEDDQVIPGRSIQSTLRGADNRNPISVSILDFPYPCVHENPFPVNQPAIRAEVDLAFHHIFKNAADFLS